MSFVIIKFFKENLDFSQECLFYASFITSYNNTDEETLNKYCKSQIHTVLYMTLNQEKVGLATIVT